MRLQLFLDVDLPDEYGDYPKVLEQAQDEIVDTFSYPDMDNAIQEAIREAGGDAESVAIRYVFDVTELSWYRVYVATDGGARVSLDIIAENPDDARRKARLHVKGDYMIYRVQVHGRIGS